MKKDIINYFVLVLLALLGSTIWIFSINFIALIPLFAFYANKGRKEAILFAIMSIIATLIYGKIYVLLLILSYILYLILYKISSIVFVDDVDSSVVSCFLTVFVLCLEKEYKNITFGYALISVGYSLISFWLYYIFIIFDNLIGDYLLKKEYKLEIKIYQSTKNEDYCGDCYDFFSSNKKKYLLLSDGMYIGEDAFNISSLVLEIIRSEIENGKSVEDSVKECSLIINKKYNCEEFSTLDLFELDKNELKIIKRGAESSFLVRESDVFKFESNSLPLGIDGCINNLNFRVRDNDILIMFSDGVKEKYPLFEKMIEDRVYGDNLNGWINKIMNRDKENQRDDFSVLIIRFVDIS